MRAVSVLRARGAMKVSTLGLRSAAMSRLRLASLAKAIDSLHAYQARVLVRHFTSWTVAKPLAQLGVDLVSVVQDERDAES